MVTKKKKSMLSMLPNPFQQGNVGVTSIQPKAAPPQPPKATGGFGPSNPAPSFINPSDWNETIRKAQNNVPLAVPTGEKNRVYENYQNMMNLKAPKPDPYKSKYQGNIDSVLDGILNSKFDYSIDTDPLYAQYKRMYNREGDRAYENALGEASGLTGGRTNTFAMGAAQQAQNYYSTQLNDKVPELYQAAYARYMQDLDGKRANIGTMSGLDQVDYGKYMDKVNMDRNNYESDRNYYNQNYLADRDYNYQAFLNDRNFTYQKDRDKVGDKQWKTSFDRNVLESDRNFSYGKEQDGIKNKQWEKSFDRNAYESDRSYGLSASNAALNRAEFEYRKQKDKEEAALRATNSTQASDDLGKLYEGMMKAEDPGLWLQSNAKWLSTEELEKLHRLLPKEEDIIDQMIKEEYYKRMSK